MRMYCSERGVSYLESSRRLRRSLVRPEAAQLSAQRRWIRRRLTWAALAVLFAVVLAQLLAWIVVGRGTVDDAVMLSIADEIIDHWDRRDSRPQEVFICSPTVDELQASNIRYIKESFESVGAETYFGEGAVELGRPGARIATVCLAVTINNPFFAVVTIWDGYGSMVALGRSQVEVRLFFFGRWLGAGRYNETALL